MESVQKQVSNLEKIINECISKGLKKSIRPVKKKTTEINKSSVYQNVYNVYSPKYYQRRKTLNGLQDSKNITFDNPIFIKNDYSVQCELEFHNITKPNPIKYYNGGSYIDIGHQDFYNTYFLASMIDQGYGAKDKPYNKPRPFIDNIKERVENEINDSYSSVGYQVQNLILDELKVLGIKIKHI